MAGRADRAVWGISMMTPMSGAPGAAVQSLMLGPGGDLVKQRQQDEEEMRRRRLLGGSVGGLEGMNAAASLGLGTY